MNSDRRQRHLSEVVVTGVGAITPLGVGAETLHKRWLAGCSGIVDGVAPAADFDAGDSLTIKERRRADRFTQLALVACDEAVQSAGWLEAPPCPADRRGCVLGSGIGGMNSLERSVELYHERGRAAVSPLTIPLLMGNAAAGAISLRHDTRGPVFGTVSACATGAHAIGIATRLIQTGDADAVLAGGSEAALTHWSLTAFGALDALSATGESRPFDARRDGFVMGEGAAVLALEDAETARRRGALPLATIRGVGMSADAFHLTAPQPDGAGAARAIALALEEAGVRPENVDYVNAHGSATPLNDYSETRAIKAVFKEHARNVPISSTKSVVGHLLGGAGAVEAVATILALRDRVAPPTVGWAERDPDLDLDYVPDRGRRIAHSGTRRPAFGISNSFGFGGHNAVLCFEVP